MKIMIANYRYFLSGGPERYMFNIIDQLNRYLHTIIPFSIKYTANRYSEYSDYFASPIGKMNEVYFHEQKITPRTFFRSISRLFYSLEVKKFANILIQNEKPDIAYVLHYLRKLSPSLLVALKDSRIPIVVRISDFAMICPQAHCFRNNRPCRLCFDGNLWPSVRWKCIHNNTFPSLLNAVATIYHRKMRFFDLIDNFVVTNPFIYQLMVDAGYPESRLKHIPTFVDTSFFKPSVNNPIKSNTFIYSGRLENIKGIHVILEAFGKLKYKRPDLQWLFNIAGTGDREYLNYLKSICDGYQINEFVSFMGKLNSNALSVALSSAQIGIVPSLCYENLPNALLECFASGLPVIASDIGSLPYCVESYKNGILFPAGDSEKLSEAFEFCIDNPQHVSAMSHQARKTAEEKYSKDKHILTLLALFSELIDRRKSTLWNVQ